MSKKKMFSLVLCPHCKKLIGMELSKVTLPELSVEKKRAYARFKSCRDHIKLRESEKR